MFHEPSHNKIKKASFRISSVRWRQHGDNNWAISEGILLLPRRIKRICSLRIRRISLWPLWHRRTETHPIFSLARRRIRSRTANSIFGRFFARIYELSRRNVANSPAVPTYYRRADSSATWPKIWRYHFSLPCLRCLGRRALGEANFWSLSATLRANKTSETFCPPSVTASRREIFETGSFSATWTFSTNDHFEAFPRWPNTTFSTENLSFFE